MNCSVCGRRITSAKSVTRGMGRVCWARAQDDGVTADLFLCNVSLAEQKRNMKLADDIAPIFGFDNPFPISYIHRAIEEQDRINQEKSAYIARERELLTCGPSHPIYEQSKSFWQKIINKIGGILWRRT